jgi:hypothetical protein
VTGGRTLETPETDGQRSLRLVGPDSSGPAPISVRVPDRPLQVALESILERHGYTVDDGSSGFVGELVASPAEATELVATVLLVDATPVWSQVGMGAVGAGLVDAVVAHQHVDDIPSVLEALLQRDLSSVSGVVRGAARLLPRLSRRQHMLLALISGEHVKHEQFCRELACSASTVKREMRSLREQLGLGRWHELPQYARLLGYSPRLTVSDISLLPDRGPREWSGREGLGRQEAR